MVRRRLGWWTLAAITLIAVLIAAIVMRMPSTGMRAAGIDGIDGIGGSGRPPVKLTWMHHFLEEGARRWLDIGTDQFMRQHEGMTIEVKAEDGSTYMSTLHSLAAIERMPDIYMTDSMRMLEEFIEAGYAMELTGHPLLNALSSEQLRGVQDERGRVWAMPFDRDGVGVFYNREAFAKAGIRDIPQTWPDFLEACRQLARAGIQPIAAGYKDVWTLTLDVQPDLIAYGIDHPYWLVDIEAGVSSFADYEQVMEGVLQRLAERFAFAGPAPFQTSWDEALQQLAAGKAAMIINGTWTVDGVRSYNPDADIGMFAFPGSDDSGDVRFALKSTGGIVINPKSRHADIAAALIGYFSTPEMAQVFQDNKRGISILMDAPLDFDPAYAELDREYIQRGRVNDYSGFYPDFVSLALSDAFRSGLIQYLSDPAPEAGRAIALLDEAFDRIRPRA